MTAQTSSPRISVLFVCYGNTCRSTMAEAILRAQMQSKPNIRAVDSCGIGARGEKQCDHRTIKVLKDHGITGYDHISRQVTLADFQNHDFILAMDASISRELHRIVQRSGTVSRAQVMLLGEFSGNVTAEAIYDPYNGTVDDYEHVYRQIRRYLSSFLSWLD